MKVALICGSVYGLAEEIAKQTASALAQAGHQVWHQSTAELDAVIAFEPEAILVVTSTTGMGELPGNIQDFFYQTRDRFPMWAGLSFAVLALGDSSYDQFCGAAEQMRELLLELGMYEVQPMLRLDASETVTQAEDAQPWLAEFQQKLLR